MLIRYKHLSHMLSDTNTLLYLLLHQLCCLIYWPYWQWVFRSISSNFLELSILCVFSSILSAIFFIWVCVGLIIMFSILSKKYPLYPFKFVFYVFIKSLSVSHICFELLLDSSIRSIEKFFSFFIHSLSTHNNCFITGMFPKQRKNGKSGSHIQEGKCVRYY